MDYSTQFTREAIYKACKVNTGGNFIIVAGVYAVTYQSEEFLPFFISIASTITISSLILILLGFTYKDELPEKTQNAYDLTLWISTMTSSFCVGLFNLYVAEYFGFFDPAHLLTWIFSVSLIEALASYLYYKPRLFLGNFFCLFIPPVIWMVIEGSFTAVTVAILITAYCPMIYLRVLELTKLKDKTVDLFKKTTERQKLLQTFIDLIPAQISWLDSDLKLIGFNKQFLKSNPNLLASELVGEKFADHSQDANLVKKVHEFLNSDHDHEIKEMELLKEGEPRWHLCHLQKELYSDKKEILIVAMDIHEQKLIEQELKDQRSMADQASKFASIGEMASGIAHEINNPLTIVQGTSALLVNMIDKNQYQPDKMKKYLKKIIDTNNRIVKIVQGMQSYSRDERHDPMAVYQLKEIVDSTLLLCSEKFKANGVTLENAVKNESAKSLCHSQQIGQIILNFLNNSFDAVFENQSEKKVKIYLEENSAFNILCVADSGEGDLDLENIFTPYFTTKPPGQGTGIGLTISQRIAKIHKGFIKAYREGGMTIFKLYLPKS